MKLWNVATGANFADLRPGARVTSVSLSSDGVVAAASSLTVKLWDVGTQQDIGTLRHTGSFNSVAFSSDGVIAAGGWDGAVKLWDVASGVNFATLWNASKVRSVVFSPDGRTLVSGTVAGTVELWDTSGLMRERPEALDEIDIPDPNLCAAIATALGKPQSASIVRGAMATLTRLEASKADISNLTGLEGSTNLTSLNLLGNNISDISPVAGLTKLTQLFLERNNISDISAVAGLTKLTRLSLMENNISDISVVAGLTNLTLLNLWGNNITDISPLVANTGMGSGDEVGIWGNPLSYSSIYTHIPVLQERGVEVSFDNRTPQRIRIVSGNDQQGLPGAALKEPFVVAVRDEHGVAFEGVPVTFAVTTGGGALSTTSTTTDANGRAESILTLGPNPGANTVEVAAAGIQEKQSVSAIAELPPIPQDVNRDDVVNILDLVLVASVLGDEGRDLDADVNRDGVVNILDLVLVAGALGNAAAAPSAWYRRSWRRIFYRPRYPLG